MITDTGLLATFPSRLLYHWRASQGLTPLPTTIEEPIAMAHTGVSPHQVRQLEMKTLQTENENLRMKYGEALKLIQQQALAIQALRTGLAAAALENGGQLTVPRATLAEIEANGQSYELGETNDPSQPVIVITVAKVEPKPDEPQPAIEPPKPTIIIASR